MGNSISRHGDNDVNQLENIPAILPPPEVPELELLSPIVEPPSGVAPSLELLSAPLPSPPPSLSPSISATLMSSPPHSLSVSPLPSPPSIRSVSSALSCTPTQPRTKTRTKQSPVRKSQRKNRRNFVCQKKFCRITIKTYENFLKKFMQDNRNKELDEAVYESALTWKDMNKREKKAHNCLTCLAGKRCRRLKKA